jgi:signal transduction histidine kinase
LAHDLKTPLAAIAMNIEFVLSELSRDPRAAPLCAALDDCRAANTRAIGIVSDMADAARIEAGEHTVKLVKVQVARLFGGLVRRFEGDAHSRGVAMTSRIDSDVIRADESLLARALGRLVERAVRHARPGSTICLESRDMSVVVRVSPPRDERDVVPIHDVFRGLAMQFTETVARALGGQVHTDSGVDGSLYVQISLARTSVAP